MFYQTVKVDPQKAKMWLENNCKNRKVNEEHVERLSDEMKAGKWVLNGQTLSFSTDGTLLDGQHRLYAIIKSGMTVDLSIAYGVEDDQAFATYDVTMLKRNVGQVAELMGITQANTVTSIARRLILWENIKDKKQYSTMSKEFRKIRNYQVLEYAKNNEREIRQMMVEMSASLPVKKCKAGVSVLASLIICRRVDVVATDIFIKGLKTGADLSDGSPVKLLRDRLVDPPTKREKAWNNEVMALTIKAWNYYTMGKVMKNLRFRREGDHPETFPIPGVIENSRIGKIIYEEKPLSKYNIGTSGVVLNSGDGMVATSEGEMPITYNCK